MDRIIWTFTDKTTGRRVSVSGPTNRAERDRLKLALRRFAA